MPAADGATGRIDTAAQERQDDLDAERGTTTQPRRTNGRAVAAVAQQPKRYRRAKRPGASMSRIGGWSREDGRIGG
jgi:hypothetical protein